MIYPLTAALASPRLAVVVMVVVRVLMPALGGRREYGWCGRVSFGTLMRKRKNKR